MKKLLGFLPAGVLSLGTMLCLTQTAQAITFTINFDNLSNPGPLDGSQSFSDANGGSDTYQEVTFGSPDQFNVTGKNYRVDTTTPGPLFAIPHSGDYYLNNRDAVSSFITTSLILTKAWFSSVEYYGYGQGALSVSVTALGANSDLATISLDLSHDPNNLGQPDPMKPMDTSSFLALSGITGYRIDRVPNGQYNANWAGDDFTFTSATSVPWETDALPLAVSVLMVGGGFWAKKKFLNTSQK